MGKRFLSFFCLMITLFFLWGVELRKEIDAAQLIRLHILANSDSDFDQALKLLVKDELITYLQTELGEVDDVALGRELLLKNWHNIENTAQQTLTQQGYDYPIRLEYGYFSFPVKYYGSFSLPAGTYEAMRVVIGEGKGSNWWCVLFPPMCFVDSSKVDNSQYTENVPAEKIVFKWRIAEWWDNLTAAVSDSDISADCL